MQNALNEHANAIQNDQTEIILHQKKLSIISIEYIE